MQELIYILLLIAFVYLLHRIACLAQMQRDLLFRVTKLLEHQGIQLGVSAEPSARVRELARTPGKQVEAIKAYREQTGLGVKEAMAIVRSLSHAPPHSGEA
jgi:hypothetical protein